MRKFFSKNRRKQRNLLLLGLMVVVILLSMFAATADNVPGPADVKVVATKVGNELEIGLNINTGDTGKFQSMGLLLSYDPTKLAPMDWGTNSVSAPSVESIKDAWTGGGLLDTQSDEKIYARAANAFTVGEGESQKGYLYLSADLLRAGALEETVATETGDATTRPNTTTASGKNIAYIEKATTASTQAVVARFHIGAGATVDDLAASIDVAQVTPADLEGFPMQVTSAVGSVDAVSYIADNTTYKTAGISTQDVNLSFLWIADGVSVNAGGGSSLPGGDYVITLFDWDGRVLDAISSDSNATALLGNYNPDPTKQTGWYTSPFADKLEQKKGYKFDKWLVVDRDKDGLIETEHGTLTSNLTPLDPAVSGDVATLTDISTYAKTDKNSKAVLLQASYVAKTAANRDTDDLVNGGNDVHNTTEDYSRYQFGEATYYQYGASDINNGQYAVRVPVSRNNVVRADTPTVLAQVTVRNNGKDEIVTVKVDLENTDATNFEVVVPRSCTQVTYTVLDTYGVEAWTTGTLRSQPGKSEKSTIIKEGAFALLMQEAWNVANKHATWSSAVNDQCLTDAQTGLSGGLEAVKTKLETASAGKTAPLTRAEVDAM